MYLCWGYTAGAGVRGSVQMGSRLTEGKVRGRAVHVFGSRFKAFVLGYVAWRGSARQRADGVEADRQIAVTAVHEVGYRINCCVDVCGGRGRPQY